jgi:hypothetical protein
VGDKKSPTFTQIKLKVMAKFYGPAFNKINNVDTNIKIITHRFIHGDGTDFLIVKPVDQEYMNFVQQMNQVDEHQGMIEDVEWKIKLKGDLKWDMTAMNQLSELVIVKEQITRKDRFGKKITLRNQECALFDMIRGCEEIGDVPNLANYAAALCLIKPEARTFFNFQTK